MKKSEKNTTQDQKTKKDDKIKKQYLKQHIVHTKVIDTLAS